MPTPSKIAIFGAGAQGRVTLDVLRAQATSEPVAFVDSDTALTGRSVNDLPVFADVESVVRAHGADVAIIVALGRNPLRIDVAESLSAGGVELAGCVHPSAAVAASAVVGRHVQIMAQAIVNSNATIGDHVIVNSGASVEHDCTVEAGASISPGTQVGGRVTIGRAAFIGTGAIILPRVSIGAGAVVGAGALVTRDVPPNMVYAGMPAREKGTIGPDFDWGRLM